MKVYPYADECIECATFRRASQGPLLSRHMHFDQVSK